MVFEFLVLLFNRHFGCAEKIYSCLCWSPRTPIRQETELLTNECSAVWKRVDIHVVDAAFTDTADILIHVVRPIWYFS